MREGQSREFGERKVLKGTVCAPHCAWGGWCVQTDQAPLGSSWGVSAGTLLGGAVGASPVTTRSLGCVGMQQSLCLLALQLSCPPAWLYPLLGSCGITKESPEPSGWQGWTLQAMGSLVFAAHCTGWWGLAVPTAKAVLCNRDQDFTGEMA